jgi:hypothetical protein
MLSAALRGGNRSRERAPDDRLRDDAIHLRSRGAMDCFASLASDEFDIRHHIPLPDINASAIIEL